jgi:CO/xanthine dehydrogenase Mo-binding subunit
MEPRSAIADYDPASERWTLRVGCQGVFGLRNGLAAVLGVERDKVRVLTGNVGGSFGMKSAVYPEYLALFHAARALGRPVKWTDERSESFVSDSHGRDHEMTAELALDADGNFLAVRVTGYGNLGAYVGRGTPIPPTANAVIAQVLHQTLGIPFDRIRLLQGDSDELIAGGGTGGSKSLMASGTAIVGASEKVIERGRQIAAHVLEAAVADVEFSRGGFEIAGTDRFIEIMELATMLRCGLQLPPELPQTLDVQHVHESSPSAFPNGCHVAEVEIGPETGAVEVVKYSMVNDFGVIVNPLLVAGQAHGGVVQGIGQALMERTVFDEEGQFLTGSFTDYALPRASDAVMFQIDSHPVPAKTNPLGAKGCGEAGCAGSLPAVMNAVVDALSEYGIRHIDMPATPHRIWQAIQQARSFC